MAIDSKTANFHDDRYGSRPQIVAWLIVLTSFVCFCAIGTVAAAGAYWFVFDSPVPLTVRLVVSQGSVNVQTLNGQPFGVIGNQTIDPQTSMTVTNNSQGVLEFLDSYSENIVATTTLTSGSQLTLTTSTRPRFEVSHHEYTITLDGFSGQMMVTATPGQRGFDMNINAKAGTASLTNDGQYTIYTDRNPSTQADQLHVFNQGGDAQIVSPYQALPVHSNTIGIASTDKPIPTNDITPPDTLLVSGLFEGQPVPAGNNPFPSGWQCYATAQPAGGATRSTAFENGAVHFWRLGENVGHGEAGCFIFPNGLNDWLDTSAYQTLRLHVRFKLEAHDPTTNNLPVQDVPVCGDQGTECPVMVELIASASNCPNAVITICPANSPSPQSWHHGFYAMADPSNPPTYPPTCDTCRVAHDHINPDVWYFYDSGDLHQQFAKGPNGEPLLYIKKLSVYASGHQYDVAIGEVTLLGSNP
ncbi:MAG: hypothetical protein ACYDBJ_08245 [Aggregatilineales bacterium]